VNLIKEKRCGKLKARLCADGRRQRTLYSKEETTSPTISINGLLLSMMIDAKEQRDVATADVQGAYLNGLMDDFVLVRITGVTVDVLCAANHIYKQFITTENGTQVVNLQVLKALYGCVKSAFLWFDLFSSVLCDMGFEINPYDSCVANKVINGSQCTVAWYVNDTKISHTDPNIVSDIISSIEKHFGEMTKTRGNKHTFLGMDVTFNPDSTVAISMTKFIDKTISESGIALNPAGCMKPARSELFDVDDSSPALTSTQAEVFTALLPSSFIYPNVVAPTSSWLSLSSPPESPKALSKTGPSLPASFNTFIAHVNCISRSALIPFLPSPHGPMPPTPFILTCANPPNKSSTPKALLKLKSLVPAIFYHPPFGHDIFSRLKDTPFPTILFFKTTRVPFSLNSTAVLPSVNEPVTSISDIFSLKIASPPKTFKSSIVPPMICLPISSPSLYRVSSSVNSATSSWDTSTSAPSDPLLLHPWNHPLLFPLLYQSLLLLPLLRLRSVLGYVFQRLTNPPIPAGQV
jgi:Reverse transcriptase (RNA-dependent DNA polymerase)